MPHNPLTIFQYNVEPHLEEIEALLDPRAKLTLVVRMPWLPDGDIILTRDDLGEVIAAIRRRIDEETISVADLPKTQCEICGMWRIARPKVDQLGIVIRWQGIAILEPCPCTIPFQPKDFP